MDNDALHTDGRFEEIVEEYSDLVYSIALTRLRVKADADDAYQETFLTLLRKKPELRNAEHLKGWLIRTAINCCRHIEGSSWRRRTVPLEEWQAGEFRFRLEEENELFDALGGLPEKYRTVLHLFYFRQMKTDEIAKALKLPPATVRSRLFRGRELMRKALGSGFDGERTGEKA